MQLLTNFSQMIANLGGWNKTKCTHGAPDLAACAVCVYVCGVCVCSGVCVCVCA